jgi:hypothetical protein
MGMDRGITSPPKPPEVTLYLLVWVVIKELYRVESGFLECGGDWPRRGTIEGLKVVATYPADEHPMLSVTHP